MKNQKRMNPILRAALAAVLALAAWSPISSQSAEPAKKMLPEGKMMDGCREMMAAKTAMMANMKAQDAKLTEQVARMNRSSNDEKLLLMASVLTQMVEQRTAMHTHMEKMQEGMMQHMMQHMQMGKETMMQCPMMKPAGAKQEDVENEHHTAQTMCPVMGGAIDKKIFADYQGKRVYFCCDACPAQFNKDPAKYIKEMEAEGIILDKTP